MHRVPEIEQYRCVIYGRCADLSIVVDRVAGETEMGINIEQWRCRIGTFSQPIRCKVATPTLKLKYVSLSIRILLFFMLVVEGVEANPGPGSTSSERGERASSIHSDRGRGRGRGGAAGGRGRRGTISGGQNLNLNLRSGADEDYRVTRSSVRLQSEQSSLSSWLGLSQPSYQPADSANENVTNRQNDRNRSDGVVAAARDDRTDTDTDDGFQTEMPPTRSTLSGGDIGGLDDSSDVKTLLLDIRRDVKFMNTKFDKLERSMLSLREDCKTLKQQNKTLSKKVDVLSSELESVEKVAQENQRKNERLESQSRRENLKFYGIDETRRESWEESERKVRTYLSEELSLDESEISIERAHRLNGSNSRPRPIIVKFSFFKDKDRILKTYREKRKEIRENRTQRDNIDSEVDTQNQDDGAGNNQQGQGLSKVRVSEDFVERVTNERTKLYPFLQDCLKEGKNAYLRYDKLVVDGVVHAYDKDKKVPVAIQSVGK